MAKRSMVAGLALALLACPVAMTLAKEPPALVTSDHGLTESVMTMRVRGDLEFGPDGTVKQHHVVTKLTDPNIVAYVDRMVASLKFQPYLQDGQPVTARTYFQMTLGARAHGSDSYDLAVDNTRFSDKPFKTWKERDRDRESKCVVDCIVSQPALPGYPVGLMRAGISGAVVVHLYLNPDGTVADAQVAQSALFSVRGADKLLDDARKLLEKESLRFARGVRAAPGSGSPLVGDNHHVAALPFLFHASRDVDNDNEGTWRLEQRGQRNVASWFAMDPDRWIGVSDLDAGSGLMAMNASRYKLAKDGNKAP